jgi:hypothetical protein
MTTDSTTIRYALIIPPRAPRHAQRVLPCIRNLLHVGLYDVTEAGAVEPHQN